MKNLLLFFLIIPFFSFKKVKKDEMAKPKLVVGIVVDQMRYDFLYRYQNRYTKNGFNYLLNNGSSFEQCFINYLPSFTGPGHASIYTGAIPAFHGIASNDWYEKENAKLMYCVADSTVANIGGSLKTGQMSPRNLISSTITDELRLASNFRSKTIAISLKDRGAILPGGHSANAAYWMDETNGIFMSSTYYMNKLPNWVDDFNKDSIAKKYLDKDWNTLYDINSYIQSSEDDNKFEGKFLNEKGTSFPHYFDNEKTANIKKTPYGNSIVFDFAKQALKNENLGKRNETDFLAVSFSATDYVGHMYGPNSIEVEDTYLRFDIELADFIKHLNQEIGEGNYLLFLTADHGVAHNPAFLQEKKIPSGFFWANKLETDIKTKLYNKFQDSAMLLDITDNYVYLNMPHIQKNNLNASEINNFIEVELHKRPEIQFINNMLSNHESYLPEPVKTMMINGFYTKRCGQIFFLLNPSWIDAYASTGTTHGTWNPYDTHIPLLFYGWHIPKNKVYNKTVNMTDIAATIASLLHIQMPNACVGKPVWE
ncbi:MAG: alkaline phosphatase family protein [Chitinophagaceae bacterium]|nr:alkaline phosphatase family protein [Chitinophagaceae bacterium]